MSIVLQRKVSTIWSSNLAYAVGLITSDGCLNKDGCHIFFTSKDFELVNNFKKALGLKNKIGKHHRGGETEKKYFYLQFGDKNFYSFLNQIGLTSAKSKTIKSVEIPDKYFADFLRGLFEGDGTFYSYRDKRWPNSFGFKMSWASASADFINWLKESLTSKYTVKGYLHKGVGVQNLEYVKGDSKKLYQIIYGKLPNLYLTRKYLKVKNAVLKDKLLGLDYLQKSRVEAGVA